MFAVVSLPLALSSIVYFINHRCVIHQNHDYQFVCAQCFMLCTSSLKIVSPNYGVWIFSLVNYLIWRAGHIPLWSLPSSSTSLSHVSWIMISTKPTAATLILLLTYVVKSFIRNFFFEFYLISIYFISLYGRYDGIQLWDLRLEPGMHDFVWWSSLVSFLFLYPSTFNLLEVSDS